MKYIIYEEKNGDIFTEEFETEAEAIKRAEYIYDHLTDYDKKQRTAFYVIESADPDENSEQHLDGTIARTWI